MATCLCSILTDREDNLLHSLRILVVVSHEELLITGVSVLCLLRKVVYVSSKDLVTIVLCLLVVVHLSVGVYHGVECETGMQSVGSTAVGTAEVFAVAVCSHLFHHRLYGCELLVNPVVEVDAHLLVWQFSVELKFERSSVEEVEELEVVESTQETNLCNLVVRKFACLLRDKLVVKRDVVGKTLIAPVHT